jgi:hypothetical protein
MEVYEGFGKRPIDWVLEMSANCELFFDYPDSPNSEPVTLERVGDAINIVPNEVRVRPDFLGKILEAKFDEFFEVEGDQGNSRIQLVSGPIIVFISIF